MIGLPGQTVDHLVTDLLFFRELDLDMIGMGPYIIHKDTPLAVQFPDFQQKAFYEYLQPINSCLSGRGCPEKSESSNTE